MKQRSPMRDLGVPLLAHHQDPHVSAAVRSSSTTRAGGPGPYSTMAAREARGGDAAINTNTNSTVPGGGSGSVGFKTHRYPWLDLYRGLLCVVMAWECAIVFLESVAEAASGEENWTGQTDKRTDGQTREVKRVCVCVCCVCWCCFVCRCADGLQRRYRLLCGPASEHGVRAWLLFLYGRLHDALRHAQKRKGMEQTQGRVTGTPACRHADRQTDAHHQRTNSSSHAYLSHRIASCVCLQIARHFVVRGVLFLLLDRVVSVIIASDLIAKQPFSPPPTPSSPPPSPPQPSPPSAIERYRQITAAHGIFPSLLIGFYQPLTALGVSCVLVGLLMPVIMATAQQRLKTPLASYPPQLRKRRLGRGWAAVRRRLLEFVNFAVGQALAVSLGMACIIVSSVVVGLAQTHHHATGAWPGYGAVARSPHEIVLRLLVFPGR